ncbi:MAG: DUF1700 domain-containing protein [Pseudomonadota bacterium]
MNKLEYLAALRQALGGLAPELIARTLAYYEQRFVDGAAAGRGDEQVAAELGEPRKIALSLRANTHMKAFEQQRSPANLLRLLVSALGLAIFNLFMVVPAIVYSALVFALYACALVFYLSGIAITAAGLSGTSELVLDTPLHRMIDDEDVSGDEKVQTHISFRESGINFYEDPAPLDKDKAQADANDGADAPVRSPVIKSAEKWAEGGLHITTDLDSESRSAQTLFGLGATLVGIILALLSIVVTRYSFIGMRRYVEMNISLLRGH